MKRLLYTLMLMFAGNPVMSVETVSAVVSLRDLNLNSQAGQREAVKRIRKQALRQCNRFGNSSRVDDRENRAECMRQAIEGAVKRLPSANSSQPN